MTERNLERLELQPEPSSVGEARKLVRVALHERGVAVDAEVAALLTSELVTNALLHARSSMTLKVDARSDRVRIGVHDSSPVPPHMRQYSSLAGTGRGLHLVDALATRWGLDVSDNGNGKWVWFELDGKGSHT